MMKNFQQFLWISLAFLLLSVAPVVHAQVSIAPVTVMIHDQTNVGTLYISNRSNETQEISLELKFGYPGSDDEGKMVMNYDPDEAVQRYRLDEKMRVFPRAFILAPGGQQTVRLQVLPGADLTDGLYWTRLSVISNAVAREVAEQTVTEGITTRINYRYDQNISTFYRKGEATTGVEVEEVTVKQDDGRLSILSRLLRTGNSPFLGSIRAELFNAEGEKVRETRVTTAAYFNETRGLSLDVDELSPGTYRLDLHYETRRRDIPARDLVQAPRVTETMTVEL